MSGDYLRNAQKITTQIKFFFMYNSLAMDFFDHPDGAERLPPDQVRFTELRAEPWPDGQRVRVHTELTPFEKRPNLEIIIHNSVGDEAASVHLIEVLTTRFVITMHIRQTDPDRIYLLSGRIYYEDLDQVDLAEHRFQIRPEPTAGIEPPL